MVCILCDSKTKTTNSRYRPAARQTWRRHTCTRCSAVFTTRESVEPEQSFRVVSADGTMSALSRDRLFLSIYQCVAHRPDGVTEAGTLTTTVLRQVIDRHSLIVRTTDLVDTTFVAIKRFSSAAASIYGARYRNR
jgi:transcriptional regulator NrdR family protein